MGSEFAARFGVRAGHWLPYNGLASFGSSFGLGDVDGKGAEFGWVFPLFSGFVSCFFFSFKFLFGGGGFGGLGLLWHFGFRPQDRLRRPSRNNNDVSRSTSCSQYARTDRRPLCSRFLLSQCSISQPNGAGGGIDGICK